MPSKLDQVLAELANVDEPQDLFRLVISLRSIYDVEHIVYHSSGHDNVPFAFETYNPEWRQHYLAEGYMHVDPVLQGTYLRFHPLDWKEADWTGKKQRKFMLEAIDAGVGTQGLSIPIRGPGGEFGGLTVNQNCSDDQWESFKRTYMRDLLLVAHYLHQKGRDLMGADDGALSLPNLSPREREALVRLARGESRGQAAEAMSISEHTLRVYVEAARHKLGALNTTHAVAVGVSKGLLPA